MLKRNIQALIMFLGLDFRRSLEAKISTKMLRLEQIVDRRLDTYFNNISLKSSQDKSEIDDLISKVRDRRLNLHVKPEFTPEVVGICKQILAFGGAGLGLVVAFSGNLDVISDSWRTAIVFVSFFYANLTMTSLFVLIWFFIQIAVSVSFPSPAWKQMAFLLLRDINTWSELAAACIARWNL